jgi:type II secretory pathway pseudopilin PulG
MKKLMNQFGVSAIELIIGLALMAGIGVVTTQLVQNQSSTNKSATRNLDVEATVKLFSDGLKKKKTCDTIFRGTTVSGLNSGSAVSPTTTPTPVSNCGSKPEEPSIMTWTKVEVGHPPTEPVKPSPAISKPSCTRIVGNLKRGNLGGVIRKGDVDLDILCNTKWTKFDHYLIKLKEYEAQMYYYPELLRLYNERQKINSQSQPTREEYDKKVAEIKAQYQKKLDQYNACLKPETIVVGSSGRDYMSAACQSARNTYIKCRTSGSNINSCQKTWESFSSSNNCSSGQAASPVNTSSVGVQVGVSGAEGARLEYLEVKVAPPTGGEGQTSATIEMSFSKTVFENGKKVTKEIRRRVVADLFVNSGGDVECSSYNSSSIETDSLEEICDMAGGLHNGNECVMDTINEELTKVIKEEVCEMIGGSASYAGSGVNARCKKISLTGKISASNLSENKVCIGSDCRVEFKTKCPANYLRSISVDGQTMSCDGVKAPTAIAEAIGSQCKKETEYSISGDNSLASANKTCSTVTYDADDNTCSTTSSTDNTQGTCKKFAAGSCSGTDPGIVVNFADGTNCGGSKVCESGSCNEVSCTETNWIAAKTQSDVCKTATIKETSNCVTERNTLMGTKDCSCTPETFSSKSACEKVYASADCTSESGTSYRWKIKSTTGSSNCRPDLKLMDGGYCSTNGVKGPETRDGGMGNELGSCTSSDVGDRGFCQQCATGRYDLVSKNYTCEATSGTSWKGCGEKKAVVVVNCQGGYFADNPGSCGSPPPCEGGSGPVTGRIDATYKITTAASGGGLACTISAGTKGKAPCEYCASRGR